MRENGHFQGDAHKRSTGTVNTHLSETTQDIAFCRQIIMDALIHSDGQSVEQLENILQNTDEEQSIR